jgi:isochorismate pyruvate lyase
MAHLLQICSARSSNTRAIAPIAHNMAWINTAMPLIALAMSDPIDSNHCNNMQEVRNAVDAVDQQIIALLVKRYGYMAAAARIKTDRMAVRDEDRKAQVIRNATIAAASHGIPEHTIAQIWEILVESSIAYELYIWDKSKS